MTYKDILVHIDASDAAVHRLDVAAKIAVSHGSHLTALHIDTIPYVPVDIMGTGMVETVREWQRKIENERTVKLKALVDDAQKRHGLNIEWRQHKGETDELIMMSGYYYDMIVIGQTGNPFDPERMIDPSPGLISISSGRPVLIVPDKARNFIGFSRILVAWKPCAEATRAIHDALPFLERADTVTLLEIYSDAALEKRLVGAEMAQHLARHGVHVTVTAIEENGFNDGQAIMNKAAQVSADLIVMGAYGHSRIRELILGGATDHLLKYHNIPLLMAH